MLFLKNGRIRTMAGAFYEKGCIAMDRGKILAVGSDLTPPEGRDVEILDAKGALVLPGLIEAHCHIGITEEKKAMEGDDCNENVEPVTPALRALDAINCMDAAFGDAVRAGITSVMVGPGSSNVVGGQFLFMKTMGSRKIDDLLVKAPAAMKIAFGENPKVNFSGMGKSPVTRMGIAAKLREELTKAREYYQKREDPDRETDFRLEAWTPVFSGEIPLKAHVHRVDDIFTAIRIAREFGLAMTLDHCSEGHLVAEEIAESGFPAIVGPDLSSRSKIEIQNLAFKTAGVLHRAGVTVAITTDHPVSLIQSLPLCAGLAVKAGLGAETRDPMGAGLEAITINPARICRVADRVGSIETGKDADIAVFDGNPMETFTRTLATVIDGNIVYRDRDF